MNIDDLTLGDLLNRCRECSECGAPTHFVGGDPARLPMIDLWVGGKRRRLFVRRVVWMLRWPARTLPDGKREVITSTCPNHRCINPELILRETKSQAFRRAAERGAWANPSARARTMRTVRAKSKLPDEGVDDIRNSTLTLAKVAQKWGVSEAYASLLRRGLYRQPIVTPFSGLGA